MNTEQFEPSDLSSSTAVTSSRVPIMSWSQTSTTMTLILALRAPLDGEHHIQWLPEKLIFESTIHQQHYKIDALWFAEINTSECKWKTLGNGDLLLHVMKDVEGEWSFPFADRSKYKGFVKIDWSRWQDVDSDQASTDDEEQLGPFSEALPSDFDAVNEDSFPNEEHSKFQDMLKGIERLGGDSNIELPKLDDMKKNMSETDIQDFLRTYNGENGEVNLDKITTEMPTEDNHLNEETEAHTPVASKE